MNEGTNAEALRDYYLSLDYPLQSNRIKADFEIIEEIDPLTNNIYDFDHIERQWLTEGE
ncbi:hypothetical protein LCGC14_2645810 [marine sediment metagenome]|uniref:Uncharacterized protein n=1 Tax=marine sediment metagenome TaxID=412755 RepID=A0A0F9AIJ7_9ZZZZ